MKALVLALTILSLPIVGAGIDTREKGADMTSDDTSADSLLHRADETFQASDYEAALALYEQVAEQARKEFNPSVETEALAQMARMNLLLGRKDEGRERLAEAKEKAVDDDPMGWSRYLGVKGRFEWKDGDLAGARRTFERMYEFCTTNALHGRAIDAAHMVAIVAESPEDQIAWGRRGIEAAEKTENEQWLGPLWNNLAGTYYHQQQYDSALTCYENAREYHWRFSGEMGKLFADYHVGMTHRKLGHLDEAARWLRPVLAWAERLENHGAIGQACEDLGEIEIARGNKSRGLEMLKRARREYKAEGYDTNWPEVWDYINKRIDELTK